MSEERGNIPGKVIRSHKMLKAGLTATLTCQGGHEYKVEVVKSEGGLAHVIKTGKITSGSNRLAIRKMQQWLDVRFPTKTTVPEVETRRRALDSLFKNSPDNQKEKS